MASPIFLLSLPRSGSTLLQKILMSHNEIATHAEPWLLLPLIYSLKKRNGIRTEYGQSPSYTFLKDLDATLKELGSNINMSVKLLSDKVYSDLAEEKEYFLDKTPRYYLIIDELLSIFPNAKFIILYRNPVSVLSSIIASKQMCNNRIIDLDKYLIDLKEGMIKLGNPPQALLEKSFIVKYEELVSNPWSCVQKLCNYLDIDFHQNMLEDWKQSSYKGSAGDTEGVKNYASISTKSVDKFASNIDNLFRKQLAIKYINSLDFKMLENMGYDKSTLLESLKNLSIKISPVDSLTELVQYVFALAKYKLKMKILGST